MTMVRFATTCDFPGCDKRSEEYAAWPSCEVCGNDTCPAHAFDKRREADVDQSETVLCARCATAEWLDENEALSK